MPFLIISVFAPTGKRYFYFSVCLRLAAVSASSAAPHSSAPAAAPVWPVEGDLAVLFLAALADFVVVSVCLVVVSFAVVGSVGATGSVGAAGSAGCTGSVGPSGSLGGWGSVGPSGSVGGSGSPVPGTVRVTVCRLWLSPKGPGSKRKPASSSWAAV